MADAGSAGITKRHSVRYRLLAIALLPTLVILPLFLGFAIYRWNDRYDATLVSKAHGDLTIAHQYLAQILDDSQRSLESVAQSARFRDSLGSPVEMERLLDGAARANRLDFLYLTDGEGRVLAATPSVKSRILRSDWPVVRDALNGQGKAAIDVLGQQELAAISPALADQAQLSLVPTHGAAPSDRTQEQRGLVVHSASPVGLSDGREAALVGGRLLNRNLEFIDRINALVYHDASLPQGSQGTATLFIDDVRVSTNVRLFGGKRALGTRVSRPVRDAVLGRGQTWLGSAMVVDDRYVSAYEPIVDSYGRRVGMLYVGFLERPFTQAKRETLLLILLAFIVVAAATIPLFLRWASSIFRPLERMNATIERVDAGDLAARTGQVDDQGEIGELARHLDQSLDRIEDSDEKLRNWNDDLNRRVEETTKQLVMKEKLATLGEISAGIAHEINNPLAIMQGNLELLHDLVGDRAKDAETEFRLLDQQVQRISEIVAKLLQFAKPAEFADNSPPLPLADLVSDTLPLVRHLLKKTEIEIERDDQATRRATMNRTELQQVLLNLLVNAIQAMPDGGRLTIHSFDSDDPDDGAGVALDVSDTGKGIPADLIDRVFDPFFTTKRHEGNGLGLSICQMLVTRAGGKLSVESQVDAGSRFAMWLPTTAS